MVRRVIRTRKLVSSACNPCAASWRQFIGRAGLRQSWSSENKENSTDRLMRCTKERNCWWRISRADRTAHRCCALRSSVERCSRVSRRRTTTMVLATWVARFQALRCWRSLPWFCPTPDYWRDDCGSGSHLELGEI